MPNVYGIGHFSRGKAERVTTTTTTSVVISLPCTSHFPLTRIKSGRNEVGERGEETATYIHARQPTPHHTLSPSLYPKGRRGQLTRVLVIS